ncbi:MAG: hypothetical protein ACKO9D_05920, partial [Gammaproteobacteria bacterium]
MAVMLMRIDTSSRVGAQPVSPDIARPLPYGASIERALATLREPVLPADPVSLDAEVFRLVHVTPETVYAFLLECAGSSCTLTAKQAQRISTGAAGSSRPTVSMQIVALDAGASDAWRRAVESTGFWGARLIDPARYLLPDHVVKPIVDAATAVRLSDHREAIWVLQGWRGYSYNLWQTDDTNSCSLGSLFDSLTYRLALTAGFERPTSTVDFRSGAGLDDREIDLPIRACKSDPVHIELLHNGALTPMPVISRPAEEVDGFRRKPGLYFPSPEQEYRLWLPGQSRGEECR